MEDLKQVALHVAFFRRLNYIDLQERLLSNFHYDTPESLGNRSHMKSEIPRFPIMDVGVNLKVWGINEK